jgi:hypothetical protein
MKHSVECQEAVKAFEEQYPNYCSRCGGKGGFYYPGTREDPPEQEECAQCIGDLKCRLCGKEFDEAWYEEQQAHPIDDVTLPCGHLLFGDEYHPLADMCRCVNNPICPDDNHLMRFVTLEKVENPTYIHSDKEEIWQCPVCNRIVRV